MSRLFFACAVLVLGASALVAGEASDAARRGEYESIQKELEAVRPEADAQREEILTFVEVAKEKLGGFRRSTRSPPRALRPRRCWRRC